MFVVGLDPCLYLYKQDTLTLEDRYILEANLVDIFEITKLESVKYLYNGYIDNVPMDNIVNILSGEEKDNAFVALNVYNSIEYFEKIYDYTPAQENTTFCEFKDPLLSYTLAIFEHLFQQYHHSIVISDRVNDIVINHRSFYFRKNLSIFTDLSIKMLPDVVSLENFEEYFSLYHWFYGRENKKILLSDTFLTQISKSPQKLHNILTSIFRGVYFPDFSLKDGIEATIYTLETHSDKKALNMEVNKDKTTLYRVHCSETQTKNSAKDRICYTKYNDYIIVFYYNDEHCNILNHYETLSNPLIRSYDNNYIDEGIKLNIKAKK